MERQMNAKPSRTMLHILRYMMKGYTPHILVVILCIIGSAYATLKGTLFMKSLVDDYITPLLHAGLFQSRLRAAHHGGYFPVRHSLLLRLQSDHGDCVPGDYAEHPPPAL